MRMRYSIEPTDRIYVSRYGFFFFAKNMGTHVTKVGKNLKINIAKNFLITLKNLTGAIKTALKIAIQKIAEATGDLIVNKIADKIASVSKSPKKLHSNELYLKTDENATDIPKGRYLSPEKRQQIIDELRLE